MPAVLDVDRTMTWRELIDTTLAVTFLPGKAQGYVLQAGLATPEDDPAG